MDRRGRPTPASRPGRSVLMDKLLEIIRSRQAPGIMVFDQSHRLLYSNREILGLIPEILTDEPNGERRISVPAEVVALCEQLRRAPAAAVGQDYKLETTCALKVDGRQQVVSLRAFLINGHGGGHTPDYVMVLVEKVVANHEPDFARVQQDFNLSRRELEVLRKICAGSGNRAIADELFISEHTVKDHIKNIMRKMQVSSRNGIIAALQN
jgi:DNA-binding CsgD family transcriptional regulator